MPLVPVLRGPAPSAALTSLPSPSFRDYPPGCALSRPLAQTNSFFCFPLPPGRPAHLSFHSPEPWAAPPGLLSPTAPAGPLTSIHAAIFCLGRPVRLPSRPRRPRTHLPAFRPPLGAGLAPPAGLKVRLPPGALRSPRRRPRPARRARDLWHTTPRCRQKPVHLFCLGIFARQICE